MKEFKIQKNDLLLMLLYSKGSSESINEPVIGVTRLMKLIFLINEKVENPEKFEFEAYKMGPYSKDVYSAIDFFNSFPSIENPILLIEKESYVPDADSLKAISDISGPESQEEGYGNNAKFFLSERGIKLAKLIWEKADEKERAAVLYIKKNYGSLSLKRLLRFVYDNFPELTVNSLIKEEIYG